MWIKNGKSEPFTKQEDNDWNFRTIISITETEFKSQLEGQNPNIEFKEN